MNLSLTQSEERWGVSDLAVGVLIAGGGLVVAGALLIWLGTHGPILSIEPAFGSIALQTAGANRVVVIAYVGIGLERLYVTGIPVGLFFIGVGVQFLDSRWTVPVTFLLGVAAASTLTVLSGCACGSGSTMFLAERTVRAILNGTAPLSVGV